MKRAVALLISAMLILSMGAFAEEKTVLSSDAMFEYTLSGELKRYYGKNGILSIPSELDNTKITSVGEGFGYNCDSLTLYINEGVKLIKDSAFLKSSLEYAELPKTMERVEDNAFCDCKELSHVVLNSENTELGKDAFKGTGFVTFSVPCTADVNATRDKIEKAKGDDDFSLNKMHTALTESMTEKDIYGENMFYCEACGFKGSKYLEDINLPFEDVSKDAWYYPYVQTVYDFNIMNGKSETSFDPNASLTCAEAAKIAAVIFNEKRTDDNYSSLTPSGDKWYSVYVDYCYENGIIDRRISFDWEKNASRAEMAYMFSRCLTDKYYINEVPLTDIPDVDDKTTFAHEILELYNMGVAVGSNQHMAYHPDSAVKRSEVAALVSRLLCYDMRIELPKG